MSKSEPCEVQNAGVQRSAARRVCADPVAPSAQPARRHLATAGTRQASYAAPPPRVLYLDKRTGQQLPGVVEFVDHTVQPPSYGVRIPSLDNVVRETVGSRLTKAGEVRLRSRALCGHRLCNRTGKLSQSVLPCGDRGSRLVGCTARQPRRRAYEPQLAAAHCRQHTRAAVR